MGELGLDRRRHCSNDVWQICEPQHQKDCYSPCFGAMSVNVEVIFAVIILEPTKNACRGRGAERSPPGTALVAPQGTQGTWLSPHCLQVWGLVLLLPVRCRGLKVSWHGPSGAFVVSGNGGLQLPSPKPTLARTSLYLRSRSGAGSVILKVRTNLSRSLRSRGRR